MSVGSTATASAAEIRGLRRHRLHRAAHAAVRHDLRVWRRAVAPTREVLSAMARADVSAAQGDTHIFLRDCHDHTVQLMEALDLGFIAWYRFLVPRAGLVNAVM